MTTTTTTTTIDNTHVVSPLGPVIIVVSSIFLIIPILLSCSLYTIACILFLTIGTFVTTYDVLINTLPKITNYWCNQLILDDLFTQIFSFDGGIFGAFCSTFCLYALPILSKDDRLRLIEPFFPDAKNIFFTPGGIVHLLPQVTSSSPSRIAATVSPLSYYNPFQISNDHQCDLGRKKKMLNVTKEKEVDDHLPNDLEWENDNDDDYTANETEFSSYSTNTPSNASRENDIHIENEEHSIIYNSTVPTLSNSSPSSSPDVTNIFLQIIQQKISSNVHSNTNKTILKYANYIKIISSITLLLHISTNKSARKVLSYAMNTSIITALLAIITTSQTTSSMIQYLSTNAINNHQDSSSTATTIHYNSYNLISSIMKNIPMVFKNTTKDLWRRPVSQKMMLIATLYYLKRRSWKKRTTNHYYS